MNLTYGVADNRRFDMNLTYGVSHKRRFDVNLLTDCRVLKS